MTDSTAPATGRRRRLGWTRHAIVAAAILVVAVLIAYVAPPSAAPIWSLAFVVAALAVGFQVVYGLLGELSLGHTAFFGSAAYAYAFTSTQASLPPVVAAIIGVATGALLGYLISQLTARLSGVYFSVVTYAINFVAGSVVLAVPFLGREEGIGNVPAFPAIGGLAINYSEVLYTAGALVILLVVLAVLRASRLGHFIEVVRADTRLAGSLAISHGGVRVAATLVSGSMAGFAGIVYAQMSRFVSPDVFGLYFIVIPLAAIAIGGRRATYGVLVGIVVVVVVPLYLNLSPTINQIAGAVLLLIVIIVAPTGILGLVAASRWGRRLSRRRRASLRIETSAEGVVLRDAGERIGDECLRLEDATVQFGAQRAVDGFSMSVRGGEIVGLIGPNGAGKSTAVNAIAGVVKLAHGRVLLGDRDITRMRPARRAGLGIGRTFQNNLLAEELTVRQSLDVAAARGRVLSRIGSGPDISSQLGIDAIADARVGDIGFLERRLLSIAMASAGGPRVLILDEATAGLAVEERAVIAGAIRRIANTGTAIIVIEHDVDFVVNLVDRLIVMQLGQHLAEGDPHEVIALPAVIETYLGAPHGA